jgi:hypothetical protein
MRCICGAEIVSANPKGVCWDCQRPYEIDLEGNYSPANLHFAVEAESDNVQDGRE